MARCDAQISFSPPQLNELWQISSAAQREELGGPIPSISNPTVRQTQLLSQLWSELSKTSMDHSCGLINENSRESRFDLELQDTYSVSDSCV